MDAVLGGEMLGSVEVSSKRGRGSGLSNANDSSARLRHESKKRGFRTKNGAGSFR